MSAPRVMRMRRAKKSRVYFRLLVEFVDVVVFARALKQLSLFDREHPLLPDDDTRFSKNKKMCGEREIKKRKLKI